jgi:prophage regulatory protein
MARSIPDWPRMLRRNFAAQYLDMSGAEFERQVAEGALPMPVKLGDELRWSRAALDEAVERLAGERAPDWRSRSKLYGVAP